jgi:CBS domain-containing protein
MMNMRHVDEVMTTNLVTVSQLAQVNEAEALAAAKGIRHLIVLGNDEQPAGMVCASDFRDADRAARVGEIMSAPVETIWAKASVQQAAAFMRREHVGSLAVVANGHVLGIVTRRDLRRAGIRQDETGGAACASCGTHHGIHPGHGSLEVCFCAECLDRALPEGFEEEIGGGD